jgi:hypothetical protein
MNRTIAFAGTKLEEGKASIQSFGNPLGKNVRRYPLKFLISIQNNPTNSISGLN